jgi:hypothetical protein
LCYVSLRHGKEMENRLADAALERSHKNTIYVRNPSDTAYLKYINKAGDVTFIPRWRLTQPLIIAAIRKSVASIPYCIPAMDAVTRLWVLKQDPTCIKLFSDPSNEEKKAAVTQDGTALEFITVQTPELCMMAVTQTIEALDFVLEQTDELCTHAINIDPVALRYVRDQTLEHIRIAVSKDPSCVRYVHPTMLDRLMLIAHS